MARPWYGNGYLTTSARVSRAQRDFAVALGAGYNEQDRRLLMHILVSTVHALKRSDGWSPISAKCIQRWARGANPKRFVSDGIVEVRPEVRELSLCREYRIQAGIIEAFLASVPPAEVYVEEGCVDLFTGEPTARHPRSKTYGADHVRYPDVVCQALQAMPQGVCNVGAVERHLANLRRDVDREARGHDAAARYNKAWGRYLNDRACLFGGVLTCKGQLGGDGIFRFVPSYNVLKTGRLAHEGGGLMSASRLMKGAAYEDIPDVHNYDLVASQATILQHELRTYQIACQWLESYLATPKAKEVFAARVGLDVDTWKKVFYALLFGSTPAATAQYEKGGVQSFTSEIGRLIYEATDAQAFEAVYARVREELLPLLEARGRWYKQLGLEDDAGRVGQRLPVNPVGLPVRKDWDHPGARLRTLAAHRLQGTEAYIIHRLTALSARFGYAVLANEHDGLVTSGTIPREALALVRGEVNIPAIRLEEKAFC